MSFYRKDGKVGQHWTTCTCKTHKKIPYSAGESFPIHSWWGLIVQTLTSTHLVIKYMDYDDYSKLFRFYYNNTNLWWGPWLWDRRKKSRRDERGKTGPGLGLRLASTDITQLVSSSNESLHFSGESPWLRGLTPEMLGITAKLGPQQSAGGRQTGCFDCIVHIWQQNSNNWEVEWVKLKWLWVFT